MYRSCVHAGGLYPFQRSVRNTLANENSETAAVGTYVLMYYYCCRAIVRNRQERSTIQHRVQHQCSRTQYHTVAQQQHYRREAVMHGSTPLAIIAEFGQSPRNKHVIMFSADLRRKTGSISISERTMISNLLCRETRLSRPLTSNYNS